MTGINYLQTAMELFKENVGNKLGVPTGFNDADYDKHAVKFMRDASQEAKSLGYNLNFEKTGKPTINLDGEEIFGATGYKNMGSPIAGEIYVSKDLCEKMPAFGRYVVTHELEAEAKRPPKDAYQHAMFEKDYVLENLKKTDMGAYVAGIALHALRNETNPEPFKAIKGYIDNAVKEIKTKSVLHARMLDRYMKKIDDAMRKGYITEDNPQEQIEQLYKNTNVFTDMTDGDAKKLVDLQADMGYLGGFENFKKYFEIAKNGGIEEHVKNWAVKKLNHYAAKGVG